MSLTLLADLMLLDAIDKYGVAIVAERQSCTPNTVYQRAHLARIRTPKHLDDESEKEIK